MSHGPSSEYNETAVSVPVHQTISNFSEYAFGYDISSIHDQAERTGRTLSMFAKEQLGAKALDASGLQVPASYLNGVGGQNVTRAAAWAMLGHYTSPDYPHNAGEMFYSASLLGDLGKIDHSARDYERRLAETRDGTDVLDMLTRTDDKPIPQSFYKDVKIGINVPEITETSRMVNVESLMARSALAFDDIVHPIKGDPRRQMMAILAAETFHAPVADALGMSAYEMAMRSEIGQVRTIGAGRPDLVDKARQILQPINGTAQKMLSKELFGHSPDQKTFHIDDSTPYGETIYFGDYDLAMLTDGKFAGEEKSRNKTIGSLAQKMLLKKKYESVLPQDVLGRVAILEDRKQLADFVSFIFDRVLESDKLDFATAASKNKPIYAQGKKDYLQDLETNIGSQIYDAIEIEDLEEDGPVPHDEAFQVVKITFNVLVDGIWLPVEYQFQTAIDREIARVGGAAHPFTKTGVPGNLVLPRTIIGDKNNLRVIKQRKEALLGGDAKTDSITVGSDSGHEFIRAILRNL